MRWGVVGRAAGAMDEMIAQDLEVVAGVGRDLQRAIDAEAADGDLGP